MSGRGEPARDASPATVRRVRARILPLLILALIVLATAACDNVSPTAATGKGISISQADFSRELQHWLDNTKLVGSADGSEAGLVEVIGTLPGSMSMDQTRQLLAFDVEFTLMDAEVKRRKLDLSTVTTELVNAQVAGLLNIQPTGEDPATQIKAALAGFPAAYRAVWDRRAREVVALQRAIGTERLTELLTNDPAALGVRCVSAIVVADEAAAIDAAARLARGEDFGAVAGEVSLDASSTSGGDVGCLPVSGVGDPGLAEAIGNAKVGVVSSPVPIEGAVVLFKVTSDVSTVDQVTDNLRAQLEPGYFQEWLNTAVTDAHVSVNPRYGSWAGGTIVDAPA
jgi:hypothetical protein